MPRDVKDFLKGFFRFFISGGLQTDFLGWMLTCIISFNGEKTRQALYKGSPFTISIYTEMYDMLLSHMNHRENENTFLCKCVWFKWHDKLLSKGRLLWAQSRKTSVMLAQEIIHANDSNACECYCASRENMIKKTFKWCEFVFLLFPHGLENMW